MSVTATKTGPASGEIAFSTTLGPEATFDYLADFTKHREWDDAPVAMEQTGGGPVGAGTTYRIVERTQSGVDTKEPAFLEVTAFDRPRLVAWETWSEKKPARSCWVFEVAPHGKGSHVTHRYAFNSPGVLGKLSRKAFLAFADGLMGGAGDSPKQITGRIEQLQHVLDVRNAVEQL